MSGFLVCCVIVGDIEVVGMAFVAEEKASLQVNVQTVQAGIAF
jgi:hypothetical protein